METINNFDDVRLAPFKSLQKQDKLNNELQQLWQCFDSIFVAESEKIVIELLSSSLKTVVLLAEEKYFVKLAPIIEKMSFPPFLLRASKELLSETVGYRLHQGIMALGKRPTYLPLSKLQSPCLLLNNLANAENVGSVIRCARYFGCNDIIIDNNCSDPFLKRTVRVSMGTVFNTRFYYFEKIEKLLQTLKDKNISLIGTDLSDQASNLCDFEFPKNSCLALGSEGYGLSSEIKRHCQNLVKIPGNADVDSLNVSVACGIFLYKLFAK
jgi:tRNA G18 (ribose-2'-O)-methylase SpoU